MLYEYATVKPWIAVRDAGPADGQTVELLVDFDARGSKVIRAVCVRSAFRIKAWLDPATRKPLPKHAQISHWRKVG